MFKRTLVSALIATTVAAGTLAGTIQPSAAHGHHHHNREIGIGIAAGVGGFVLGSLLSQQQPQPVYVDEYGGGSWHVRRCLARYASYDPDSNTYIGYDGYPHYCRL
ncbi:BA14K family protein [Mesorhizobium captivum]|uniref:BA14K family protein n=1 Tax=Mesorhizobium captivum TaxID=3072319 RepID=UPI002A23C5E6|nr:BA14K family protein [Mesorhizobium sp. VK3C]MDX8446721.1 BA14K family protein [Mesorhizobium sp. VK3C]